MHAFENGLADLHKDHAVTKSAAVLLRVFGVDRCSVGFDAHDRLPLLKKVNLGVVGRKQESVGTLLNGVKEILRWA